MTDSRITDFALETECAGLARDIVADFLSEGADFTDDSTLDEMRDRAHEAADGHQWVIYTYHARNICAACDVSQGEEFLEDVGMPDPVTFDGLATTIVYGEMRARIESALEDLWEDAAEAFEAAADARADAAGAREDAADSIIENRAGDMTPEALRAALAEARGTMRTAVAALREAEGVDRDAARAGWRFGA